MVYASQWHLQETLSSSIKSLPDGKYKDLFLSFCLSILLSLWTSCSFWIHRQRKDLKRAKTF